MPVTPHADIEAVARPAYARPRLVASRCLGFAPTRWNGAVVASAEVTALLPHVDFVTVCPEVDIGLGVPRDPVRIVGSQGGDRLLQPATGRDVTDELAAYAESRLAGLGHVDGFVLKTRSPSCAVRDAKRYAAIDHSAPSGRAAGMFGRQIISRFADLPVEDEGRLTNSRLRERFLAAVFTLAAFRALRERASGGDPRDASRLLTEFHASNKLLLMAQNQTEMRRLGRIAANHEGLPVEAVYDAYFSGLARAFASSPRCVTAINVLMHAMGYFKDRLSHGEKQVFLDLLETYRAGRVPLSAPVAVLREWIARFDEPYLASQTFFAPYPEDLVSVRDSGQPR